MEVKMKVKDYIGKTCLLQNKSPDHVCDWKFLRLSKSGKWVKIESQIHCIWWANVKEIEENYEVLEILEKEK